MTRQRELEIYVRGCRLEDILAWAEIRLGALAAPVAAGDATVYDSPRGPLIVTPEIEGGPFVSLWFNTPSAPWSTDVECARDAVHALRCTVRCDPGGAGPGPSTFLELDGENERLIEWE